jgi:hypothetical protein
MGNCLALLQNYGYLQARASGRTVLEKKGLSEYEMFISVVGLINSSTLVPGTGVLGNPTKGIYTGSNLKVLLP